MRQIDVPMSPAEQAFQYFCPICGIELSVSNYETPGSDYFCPYCSTDQRPSRVLNT
jgi:DNA-directed RNA polymerase subunit RPC12/RpoP